MRITITREMVEDIFREVDETIAEDPFACESTLIDVVGGVFACVNAIADNLNEATDLVLEFYDPRLEDYARFYADCEVPARGSTAL